MFEWSAKKIKVSELKEYEGNPRDLTEKGMADLKKSITKFGLAEPICCNPDYTIIGGHARKKTLETLGIKEVNIYVPNKKLNTEQIKELNVRLNKNQAGVFNFDMLANEFSIDELLDFGFDEKELDINLWNKTPEEKLDEVPEVQKEAVSKLGDIFLLNGKHRVMCGDSTNSSHVSELCANKRADMLFTDPPYNVDYEGKTKDKLKIKNDKIGDFVGFLTLAFANANENMRAGAVYYIAHPDVFAYEFITAIRACKWKQARPAVIQWVKDCIVMGRGDYHAQSEPLLYGWKEGAAHFEVLTRNQSNVWQNIKKPSRSEEHPTMKPVELMIRAIKNHSVGLILDLFLGSGSTLIACEQTNRICYGMEIDEHYIDVILKRYHNLYPDKKIECLNRKNFNFENLFNG